MNEAPTPAAASRRRGAALESAILDAAWAEVRASGYARVTMDGVAARARTSKAVLYRRWPNRAALVLAALRRHAPMPDPSPDTGSLRGDLLAILARLSDRYRDHPEITRGLMVELPDAGLHVSDGAARHVEAALDRAEARSEVRPGGIGPRLLRLPLDLVRYELFRTKAPLSEEDMIEIVDTIVLPLLLRR